MLGGLLRSDGFPRWLVASALDALVADASASLAELSGGQFELTHDRRRVPRRRPRRRRLAPAGQDAVGRRDVPGQPGAGAGAVLAAVGPGGGGAARLESIFLDEGFGTLDETNLDVVASTLENLAAQRRPHGRRGHPRAGAGRAGAGPVRGAAATSARRRSSGRARDVPMRFTVDPWDPGYGASLDTELGASTAAVDPDIEVPAARWAPVDPVAGPAAGGGAVRRRRAPGRRAGVGRRARTARQRPRAVRVLRRRGGVLLPRPRRPPGRGRRSAAASFTTVADAADVRPPRRHLPRPVTTAPARTSHRCRCCRSRCSAALAEVELEAADWRRVADRAMPRRRRTTSSSSTARCAGAPHLPRASGFVKSHRSDYLPPQLGAVVAQLDRGSAPRCSAWARRGSGTPGTCGCRAAPGAPVGRRRAGRVPRRPAADAVDRARDDEPGDAARGTPPPSTRTPARRRTSTRSPAWNGRCAGASASRRCSIARCAGRPRGHRSRWGRPSPTPGSGSRSL